MADKEFKWLIPLLGTVLLPEILVFRLKGGIRIEAIP